MSQTKLDNTTYGRYYVFSADALRKLIEDRYQTLSKGKEGYKLNKKSSDYCLYVKEINELVLNELHKSATFYHYEEIKVQSSMFDVLASIKDINMSDIALVKEITEDLVDALYAVQELTLYLAENFKNLRLIFQEYELRFKVFKHPEFEQFKLGSLTQQYYSPLRVLIEHLGVQKAFFQAQHISNSVITPELTKIQKFYRPVEWASTHLPSRTRLSAKEGLDEMIPEELEPFEKIMPVNEKSNNKEFVEKANLLSDVLKSKEVVDQLLKSLEPFFYSNQNVFWRQNGFYFRDYSDKRAFNRLAEEFMEDTILDKDDFISSRVFLDEANLDIILEGENTKASPDRLSLWFVLIHTMLYLLNYYGLYPISFFEAGEHIKESFIVGVTPFSALIFTWLLWNRSWLNFYSKFLLSLISLIIANVLFLVSGTSGNMALIIIGRILIGFGGLRMVTKKFVSLMVYEKYTKKYSSTLTLLSNLGRSFGPLLCSLFTINQHSSAEKSKGLQGTEVFLLLCIIIWGTGLMVFFFAFNENNTYITKKVVRLKRLELLETARYNELCKMNWENFKDLKETDARERRKPLIDTEIPPKERERRSIRAGNQD